MEIKGLDTLNILAIESAAKAAGAAVFCDGELLAESFLNNGLTHSCTLMREVDAVLSKAGKTLLEMDVIAVDAGPGSFTGIRIGLGTAKGLALGADKKIAPVSSLFALAFHAAGAEGQQVVPIMDARRGEVYTATYQIQGGVPTEVVPMRAIPLAKLLEELDTAIFVGDGVPVHRATILEKMGNRAQFVPSPLCHHRAFGVGMAAHYTKAVSVHDAAPIYLRLAQAEREWNEKHLKEDKTCS